MCLLEKVKNEIGERRLLKPGEKIVLGISGGVDSCVLLDILLKMNQYEIVLAHINHSLRETALRDEEWVKGLAKSLGVKVDFLSCKIKELSKKRKESLEACGRHVRYRFFKETAAKYGAHSIVTAHTADDQLETIALNYHRGMLERGARGIAWRRQLEFNSSFYVARPLLSVWKKEIYEYAARHKIKFHEDESNLDTTIARNFIRHKIIAKLDEVAKKEIWTHAEKFRTQEYDREQKALKFFKKNIRVYKDQLFLSLKDLLTLDQPLQHRLLEKMFQHVLQRGDFLLLSEKFNVIEKVLRSPKAHAKIEIQIGLFLHKQYNEICVTDHDLFMQKTFSYRWNVKGPLEIKESGYVLTSIGSPPELDCFAVKAGTTASRDEKKTAYLDAEKVGDYVIVRNRRDGDRIKPLGMKNYKKVKKILIDAKIPLAIRNNLPIVQSCDGSIMWIAGLCISDDYKIGKTTRKILKISLNPQ